MEIVHRGFGHVEEEEVGPAVEVDTFFLVEGCPQVDDEVNNGVADEGKAAVAGEDKMVDVEGDKAVVAAAVEVDKVVVV